MALNFSRQSPFYDRGPISETGWNLDLGIEGDRGRVGSPETRDIVDLLPADPFGMDISSTFSAIAGWIEDFQLGYRDDFDMGVTGSGGNDILDILPADPFGMDVSSTLTTISGWLENLDMGYGPDRRDDTRVSIGGCNLCAQLDYFWNEAMDLFFIPPFESPSNEYSDVIAAHSTMGSHEENYSCSSSDVDASFTSVLHFALPCLGVKDLLSVGMVCRDLHSIVCGDPLLWQSIYIDNPLNERITDDALLELTNRAQGNLRCLSLVECSRISIDVLKVILDRNPNLTKLGLSGCTRLNINEIVILIKVFNGNGTRGIRNLRIGGLYGVTYDHFEELKVVLGVVDEMKNMHGTDSTHFYGRGSMFLPLDDNRAIDIELCPRCKNLRLVYDCPSEICQSKEGTSQACRACVFCIERCVSCGRCIDDDEYEETFCLEFMCSTCWRQIASSPVNDEVRPLKLASHV